MTAAPLATSCASTLGNRFAVRSVLRTGDLVRSLLAVDVRSGAKVVVKAVQASAISAGVLERCNRELSALASAGGGLVAPIAWEVDPDAGAFFVAWPYVEGSSFAQRLRAGALSPPEVVCLGRSLLRALAAAHGVGAIHRNLRPSNVIEPSGGGAPVLVDFGVGRTELAGAPKALPPDAFWYLPPEQTGPALRPLDARADLYALGAMLWHALAGHPPFDAPTAGEVLLRHLRGPRVDLRRSGIAAPRALEAVLQRLVSLDPADRYASSAAALADFEELADGTALRDPAWAPGTREPRDALLEPAFVGRGEALQQVLGALSESRGVAARPFAVLGGVGAGKTRFLDELVAEASAARRRVVRVSSGRAAVEPFAALSQIARELARLCSADAPLAEAVRRRLGELAGEVSAAFPALRDLLGPPAPRPDEARALALLRRGLVELLAALGETDQPTLLLLDDAHNVAPFTLGLLEELWAREPRGLVFALGWLDGARAIPAQATALPLPPLSPLELRRMAESAAGPLPAAALAWVGEKSQGSPLHAAVLWTTLVEEQVLQPGPDGWRCDEGRLSAMKGLRELEELLGRRLDSLPERAIRILASGAVLQGSADVSVVSAMTGIAEAQVVKILRELERRMLASLDAGRGAFTCREKAREAALARLTSEQRADLHRRAALALAGHGDSPFAVAFHWDAAGESARAFTVALAAAAQARARVAFQAAEAQYGIALRGAPASGRARFELLRDLGTLLLADGAYERSEEPLTEARALVRDPLEVASLDARLAEAAFKRGQMRRTLEITERAMAQFDLRLPRTAWGSVLAGIVGILSAALVLAWQQIAKVKPRGALEPTEQVIADLSIRRGHAIWFGAPMTLYLGLLSRLRRGLTLPPRERSMLAAVGGLSATVGPVAAPALASTAAAVELARDARDPWAEALRPEDARPRLLRAGALARSGAGAGRGDRDLRAHGRPLGAAVDALHPRPVPLAVGRAGARPLARPGAPRAGAPDRGDAPAARGAGDLGAGERRRGARRAHRPGARRGVGRRADHVGGVAGRGRVRAARRRARAGGGVRRAERGHGDRCAGAQHLLGGPPVAAGADPPAVGAAGVRRGARGAARARGGGGQGGGALHRLVPLRPSFGAA